MPLPIWSATYLIGHSAIDAEHRRLLDDLAAIYSAAPPPRGSGALSVLDLFDAWLDDFARHAQEEERMMDQLRTPAGIAYRQRHVDEHTDFLHQAMDLRNSVARGDCPQAALDALGELLISQDLVRSDFELIGLLLREAVPIAGK